MAIGTLVRGGRDCNDAACRSGAAVLVMLAVALCCSPPTAAQSAGEPPVPQGTDPGGVAVALIDTGVNYTLPHIAPRLARGPQGDILGFDFQDGDRRPFDLAPGRRGRHHGTRVATILLAEAPKARLVPYRFKAGDFDAFARIVAHIAAGPARIVALPLGGYRQADWEPLRQAMAAHPELLFVVSAGNDGRNIDARPVYPAAFGLENALVVTSTDAFGRLARESNWGPKTVDISTPGERLATIDHAGTRLEASGSSFAVPRIAALAARLSAANPEWSADRLKRAILAAAVPSPGAYEPRTRSGWIANPALVSPDPP